MKIVHHFCIIRNNSAYKLIHNTTDITRWSKKYFQTKKLASDFSKADNLIIFCNKLGKLVCSFYYVTPFIFGSTFPVRIPYISALIWKIKMFFRRIYWLGIYEGYKFIRRHYDSITQSDNFKKLYWITRAKAIKLGLIKGKVGEW